MEAIVCRRSGALRTDSQAVCQPLLVLMAFFHRRAAQETGAAGAVKLAARSSLTATVAFLPLLPAHAV